MRSPGLVFSTIVILASAAPNQAAEPERPDMVIFLADDLSWADCSPEGGQLVPTPNMDRVASDGLTFTHAFVASPSCAPSRGALLTGLDPMRNGAMRNHARPRRDLKTWPDYFHDLGYQTDLTRQMSEAVLK